MDSRYNTTNNIIAHLPGKLLCVGLGFVLILIVNVCAASAPFASSAV